MIQLRKDFIIGQTSYILTSYTDAPAEEITKLKKLGLPIFFYDYDEAYFDEVGGFHDCAEGWNPNGVWCGECTKASCANCSSKDSKKEDYCNACK